MYTSEDIKNLKYKIENDTRGLLKKRLSSYLERCSCSGINMDDPLEYANCVLTFAGMEKYVKW